MAKFKTLIVGASPDPSRYSHMALERLVAHGHAVEGIGLHEFFFKNFFMGKEKKNWPDIDTVTLYISPKRQPEYYAYLLSLKPRRIIFNPGTENPVFAAMAEKEGIQALEACTLVMLSTGQYGKPVDKSPS